jgi:hypothetical protein
MLLSKENQAAKPFNRKHVGFSAAILQVPAPSLQRKIIAFILISGEKRKPSSEHRSSTVTYGRGGGDRTRDPRSTSPELVRLHQLKARSRISPNRRRLPKDSATHNGREEAVGRVGQFTAFSKC